MLFALFACSAVVEHPVTATLGTEINTLVHVTWESPTASLGWVEYGPDRAYGHSTPLQPESTVHGVTLFGIPAVPPGTTASWTPPWAR